jgi:hypothetical protein
MSNRWKGNFIIATEATSDGTAYTGKANGSWSLNNQAQQKQANLWAKPVGKPTAPTIGTASISSANAGGMTASIGFTPSSDMGTASGTLSYTAVSNPGNYTGSSASSPLLVAGLNNGVNYTFTLSATNSLGYISDNSSASLPIGTTIPTAPTIGTATAGAGTATITFTPPSNTGGLPITGYTATSTPGNITGTATSSPISISGLTNGISYTFKVIASNLLGNSSQSAASNSVIPSAAVKAIGMGGGGGTAQAYSWSSGLGTQYIASPGVTTVGGFSFSSQTTLGVPSSLAAICSNDVNGKGIYVYDWGAGFGAKYSDITTPIAAAGMCKFTADNSAIIVACLSSPYYIVAYAWSAGFGTKYADPTTMPTSGISRSVDISSDGTLVTLASTASPYTYVYPWSSSGFGTKFANPAILPDDQSWQSTVSRTKNYIAVSNNFSGINVYNWSNGFGTKFANPTTIGTLAASLYAKFTANDGAIITDAMATSPYIVAIAWSSSGFGTKYANPISLGTTTQYSPFTVSRENADLIAVRLSASPYLQVLNWNNTTGWGSTYANPSTLPTQGSGQPDFNF